MLSLLLFPWTPPSLAHALASSYKIICHAMMMNTIDGFFWCCRNYAFFLKLVSLPKYNEQEKYIHYITDNIFQLFTIYSYRDSDTENVFTDFGCYFDHYGSNHGIKLVFLMTLLLKLVWYNSSCGSNINRLADILQNTHYCRMHTWTCGGSWNQIKECNPDLLTPPLVKLSF